ncbi:MAG: chemotaxis protein CheA [Candidatus Riflebacteria bacterium]|nr:chemotaxis protein CheA [Candidatus Riflebacteria bacterium]
MSINEFSKRITMAKSKKNSNNNTSNISTSSETESFYIKAEEALFECEVALNDLLKKHQEGLIQGSFKDILRKLRRANAFMVLSENEPAISTTQSLKDLFSGLDSGSIPWNDQISALASSLQNLSRDLLIIKDFQEDSGIGNALKKNLDEAKKFLIQSGKSKSESVQNEEKSPISKSDSDHQTIEAFTETYPPEKLFDEAILRDFRYESTFQLQDIEELLLSLDENHEAGDRPDLMFRSFHSFKGNIGLLISSSTIRIPENAPIVILRDLVHATETFLEKFRGSTAQKLDSSSIEILFRALDSCKELISRFFDNLPGSPQHIATIQVLKNPGILTDSALPIKPPQVKIANEKSVIPIEKIFIAQMLNDFSEEVEIHLQTIEKGILEVETGNAASGTIKAMMRDLHSIKGAAAMLISTARYPLTPKNPLYFIRAIAHATETIVSHLSGKTDVETSDLLFVCLDSLKMLKSEFLDGRISPQLPEDLLVKLAIDLTHFRDEDITLFTSSHSNFKKSETPDWKSLSDYSKAMENLLGAAKRINRGDISEALNYQIDLLKQLSDPAISDCKKIFHQISNQHQKILQKIYSPEPTLILSKDRKEPVKQISEPQTNAQQSGVLRVDEEKVDKLLSVVGELFIAKGIFPILVKKLHNEKQNVIAQDLKDAASGINRLSIEMQNLVMSIRMLPVKTLFQKYPRLVRDLSQQLGKKVHLELQGEYTEIDKSILDILGDPLVHLIRNAVDHGLETPEERAAKNKSPEGRLILSTRLESGMAIIKVSDDGKGLNSEKLKKRAIEKRIVTEEAATKMSEKEAFELIFLPGFSTAGSITDVSGRGVGMDIVRNKVSRMQGVIEIESREGTGTTFTLKLPTTLLITKTILVLSDGIEYLIPMENILMLGKHSRDSFHSYHGRLMSSIKGVVYPTVPLSALLNNKSPVIEFDNTDSELIPTALINSPTGIFALTLSGFAGEEEVVIKPFTGEMAKLTEVFAGAVIMGDGRVVLALSPDNMAKKIL